MLDRQILAVAGARCEQELRERVGAFEREVSGIEEEMKATGMYYSSAAVWSLMAAIEAECHRRAKLIWEALARAVTGAGAALDSDCAAQAKAWVAETLAEHDQDLREHLREAGQLVEGLRWITPLEAMEKDALDRVNSEIARACRRQSKDSGSGST